MDDLLTTWLESFDSSLDATKTAIETACDGLAVRATVYAMENIDATTDPYFVDQGPAICLYQPGQLNCFGVIYNSPSDTTTGFTFTSDTVNESTLTSTPYSDYTEATYTQTSGVGATW